jgi:hypothetical protein
VPPAASRLQTKQTETSKGFLLTLLPSAETLQETMKRGRQIFGFGHPRFDPVLPS